MGTFLFSRVGDILVVAIKLYRVLVSCRKRTELAPTVFEVEKHKR